MKIRRWLLWGGFGLALYFAVFGGGYSLFDLLRIQRDHDREVAELRALEAEVERMSARADSLENDPAAIERVARERYGMIKDGERLYRFVDSAGSDSVPRENRPDR